MNNEEHIEKEIESIFDDAWKEAPTIAGLNDLGEHIAKAIKDVSDHTKSNYQNLIKGKISIFEDADNDQERGKGALELQIITSSSSPIHEMLEDYSPTLEEDQFLAVMTQNSEGQLTLIAFANGVNLTTLTSEDDEEIGVSDYDHTIKMFKDAGAESAPLVRIFDRLIEIAQR